MVHSNKERYLIPMPLPCLPHRNSGGFLLILLLLGWLVWWVQLAVEGGYVRKNIYVVTIWARGFLSRAFRKRAPTTNDNLSRDARRWRINTEVYFANTFLIWAQSHSRLLSHSQIHSLSAMLLRLTASVSQHCRIPSPFAEWQGQKICNFIPQYSHLVNSLSMSAGRIFGWCLLYLKLLLLVWAS